MSIVDFGGPLAAGNARKNPTLSLRRTVGISGVFSSNCEYYVVNRTELRTLLVIGAMNIRKRTKALGCDDITKLHHIWCEARRIWLPLNVMISVKPDASDAMTTDERCALWNRIKNLYGQFSRRHGFPNTYIWVRESLPDGSKEHLHVLCHVPPALRDAFLRNASEWLPGVAEMDVRRASQGVRQYRNGKTGSAIGYLIKNMTPQAAFRRSYIRKKGGPVMGKMWGCSRNLKSLLG